MKRREDEDNAEKPQERGGAPLRVADVLKDPEGWVAKMVARQEAAQRERETPQPQRPLKASLSEPPRAPPRPEADPPAPPPAPEARKPATSPLEPFTDDDQEVPSGRYDFDLAEFPLFRFERPKLSKHGREPLEYRDTITGKDGEKVERVWRAYPGPEGWGGATTQDLLYDLLQLYVSQKNIDGRKIEFRSLRHLLSRRFKLRDPENEEKLREPSASDFARIRRDLDILRGYDFRTTNAYWDKARSRYVDMHWRLFDTVFYFNERPDGQKVFEWAYVEVSTMLQTIARTRGFFAIGFPSELFFQLKPLEKRLALYLAKKFASQSVHKRFAKDLARALPIEAARPDNVRAILKRAADGLLEKKLPILKEFHWERSSSEPTEGEWIAVFDRAAKPRDDSPIPAYAAEELAPEVEAQLYRILDALGPDANQDRLWWIRCAKVFGEPGVSRALGQLKDAPGVRSPGALLTKIFKDLAEEWGKALV